MFALLPSVISVASTVLHIYHEPAPPHTLETIWWKFQGSSTKGIRERERILEVASLLCING